ncbi:MAG: extracellular solute-binding protein [Atribacterota bacterium]|nr:extracellular solute-binding protein [Verrucomicrobiota bacterium]MDD2352543.1 extracellular solute-binding protein [Atribacterota bacterium]MDD3641635.1 extracellular solute-binding protein [Atribacterota bacterium]MDD4289435.1 extracellular solute-binding protein [Atribacterota bacterium]MDD4765312.1 extracellular solute-binding protein [Atribacterota bacterium]
MKLNRYFHLTTIITLIFLLLLCFSSINFAQEKVRLVYMTAGDVNMLALGQHVIGPLFTEQNPNVEVMTVHVGPGNAGSSLIFEKVNADKEKEAGDIDVAMVHEIFLRWSIEEDLLMDYAKDIDTWQYVTSPFARTSLGVNVEGYCMPMFHSQTVLAYNPKYVTDPPKTYEEIVKWTKENPGKFGYNGIKGGMSGVAFTVGWIYWKTGNYEKYAITGPFEEAEIATWDEAIKELKEFDKNVTLTGGNVATLDALNRGEIWMGPVWVDMFLTWMAEGKLDPETRLILPEPGMPGQPMYFVIPKNTRHPEEAKKFVELVTSPEFQAEHIVKRFNWYPGIDGNYIKDYVDQETFDTIYQDVTPEMLSKYGLAFPLADYFDAMLEAAE